jgi:hypothetical protein
LPRPDVDAEHRLSGHQERDHQSDHIVAMLSDSTERPAELSIGAESKANAMHQGGDDA